MQQITISSQTESQRLDRFLEKKLVSASKSFIYKMLRKKNITLNGKKASGTEKLKDGDIIQMFFSDETYEKFSHPADNHDESNKHENDITKKNEKSSEKKATIIDKKEMNFFTTKCIIYEDKDIIVINKPVGMLSQKAVKDDISLVEYINEYLKLKGELDDDFKAAICNRLDRNTSGIIVAGKSIKGLQWMNHVFDEHFIKKYYLCIVCGAIKNASKIDGYLIKDSSHNQVKVSSQKSDEASHIITAYEPVDVKRFNDREYTLLKVRLYTGKSHQIRAHLKSIGHCVIGDSKYGLKNEYHLFKKEFGLTNQLLHAFRLELPDDENIPEIYRNKIFEAPLPDTFKNIVDGMKFKM